jgi:predicted TIM-barrel fold metal-dependent hydrolase
MLLSGVFEKFPGLKYVLTELGGGWLKDFGKRLDGLIKNVKQGSQGELRFTEDMAPKRLASEYIYENVYLGVSMASKWDVENRDVVAEGHWMWGSDYPHDEGTHPFTREHLRLSMEGIPTEEKRKLLAGNCAELYDFDMKALDREAAKHGPLVSELDTPLKDIPPDANMALARAASTGQRDEQMI